jgi:hypothetical protein
MKKILAIHLLAITLSLVSCRVEAFTDYEVDWPTSVSGQSHTLRITIDGCTSLLEVKDKDLEKFSNSKESMMEAIKAAISKKENGCK